MKLANVLGSELGIEVDHLLYKIKTLSMKRKTYLERMRVVRGLYQILHSKISKIRGKHILLVDDIVTSGFTVSECSKILIDAGAKKVDVVALARTIPGGFKYV